MSAMMAQANNVEPLSDLVEEEECDTLLLYLSGFTKEQLSVELTKSGVLKISGARPLPFNQWSSFQKDFQVSKNCQGSKITAKFEEGILYVRQPKRIVPDNDQQAKKTAPADAKQQAGNEKKTASSDDKNKHIKDANPEEESDPMEDAKTSFHEEMNGEPKGERNDKNGTTSREQKEQTIKGTNTNGVFQVKPQEKVKMAKQMTVIMVLELVLAFALGICVSNLHWFYQK